jgi:sulfatase maturation enzyme AslB (radical SAM superfamily)
LYLLLLARADSLDAIVNGGNPYPIDWHIFPSNKCNHLCTWCMYRHATPSGTIEQFDFGVILPRKVLLRGVQDAARTGASLIHFSGGGEPLINKHTLEAMTLAQELARDRPAGRRMALKVAMSTNGRLLTPEVAAQVDYIRVSLNAGTPEQHTATNHAGEGPGDWHTILERIEAAIPHKRGDIGLGFVVDHENYQDIPPFVDMAVRLGVDFVHIRPAFYYETESDAAVRAVMPAVVALCEDAKRKHEGAKTAIFAISDKFAGYWTPREYHACRAVMTGTTLRATGDFAVCQDRTDLVFGTNPSYKNGATFEEVWNSDQRRRLIATIHDGEGGELSRCPRCVWGNRNNLIDAWERDDLRISLI